MRERPKSTERQIPRNTRPPPRLKRRADFLRAAKGERFYARTFTLQLAPPIQTDEALAPARFGITVTKRIGGAVERNRIRRRLKEALRLLPDLSASSGRDYVIVAKAEALTADFQALQAELATALRKIQRPAADKPARRKAAPRQS